MRCRVLYVGITHPDIVTCPAASPLDLHGSAEGDNPLSYFERYEMIRDALLDFGLKRTEFEITPFPVSRPEILLQYAPRDAVYYMNICGEWDEEKCRILTSLGLKVEVLRRKKEEERGITGTQLRQMIAREENWQQYVPKTAVSYITGHGIDQRIKQQYYVG